MNISRIHHLNIRCAPDDLAAIEQFYAEVLGLLRGYRPPNLRNRGVWLYLGEDPVIHVTARCAEGYVQGDHRGSIDHVAFQSSGAAGFLARLAKLDIPCDQQNVPGAGYQVFVRDPVGTTLEFNFPNSEAPESVASGTPAARQTLGAG